MKKRSRELFTAVLLVGGLAAGVTTVGDAQPRLSAEPGEQREARVRRELGTFAELARELNPSVVNISVVKRARAARISIPEEFQRMIPRELLPQLEGHQVPRLSGQGSGVIVSSDGEILTNNHVVQGASEIRVKLSDGRELDAEIIGTDEHTDLALLKLREGVRDLTVARLGDSDELAVGEWVMAIGNPFGLEATVTVGVLSGKGRVIGAGPYDDFLQTDTSINPGNSGGPLFNIDGEVVGINTAIVRGGQGIGFAIPINLAREVTRELKAQGVVERGFIGVGIQPLTPALKSALSIPEEISGALVSSVVPGGPAERAGIQVSDVITGVAGNRIESDRELLREVAALDPGSTAELEIVREGRRRSLKVEIDRRPGEEVAVSRPSRTEPESRQEHRVGLAVVDRGGVPVVAQVLPNSPAARAGLRPGDQIRAVGRSRITSAREFIEAISEAGNGDIAILVERGGRTSFVLIES